jgi:hypothetical protein
MVHFGKFAALPPDWVRLGPGVFNKTRERSTGERLEVTLRFVYAPSPSDDAGRPAQGSRRKKANTTCTTVNLPVGVLISSPDRTLQRSESGHEVRRRPAPFRGLAMGLLVEAAIGLSGWISVHEILRLVHW